MSTISPANLAVDSIIVSTLADLSAAGAGQVKFPATQNASANANTLDDYKEGTFTATLTGCTTAPTASMKYTKIGNQVTIELPGTGLGAVSNTTAKTLTGMPSALFPAAARYFLGIVANNSGALVPSLANVGTGGVISFAADSNGSGWTASGNASIWGFSFTYTLA